MANTPWIYRSKVYPFGNAYAVGSPLNSSAVTSAVKSGYPTRLYVTASYGQGTVANSRGRITTDEHIRIAVNFGRTSGGSVVELPIIDTRPTSGVTDKNNMVVEGLTDYLPLSGGVPDPFGWSVQLTVTIFADEKTKSDYAMTETFIGYCYRDDTTNRMEFRRDRVPPNVKYTPVSGVQVGFYSKGTNLMLGHDISDVRGRVEVVVPVGSYDVQFRGNGYTRNDWLTGDRALAIGQSSTNTPFGVTNTTIAKAAEFGTIKTAVANYRWPGYLIPEDFTDDRKSYKANLSSSEKPVDHYFGRIYKGLSWVEYVGIAVDPSPK